MYTWGKFGSMRIENENQFKYQLEPRKVNLKLVKKWAVAQDSKGKYSVSAYGDAHSLAKKSETVTYLKSICWSENHCVFVDKQNRVFAMGNPRYGRLGTTEP